MILKIIINKLSLNY